MRKTIRNVITSIKNPAVNKDVTFYKINVNKNVFAFSRWNCASCNLNIKTQMQSPFHTRAACLYTAIQMICLKIITLYS